MDVQIRRSSCRRRSRRPTAPHRQTTTTGQSYIDNNWDKLGYRSYVQFMMYYGARTSKPGGTLYTPLSQFSADCPWHSEATAGGTFSFPPREQPTHAARRAIIAAHPGDQRPQPEHHRHRTSAIGSRSSPSTALSNGGRRSSVPLTSDYDAAMQGCTTLQAVADAIGASTATEVGLIAATQPHQAAEPRRTRDAWRPTRSWCC